jgi:hypothetical protein
MAAMVKQFLLGLGAAALLGVLPAAAQTPLFSDHTELEVIIEAPLNTLVRNARRSTDPHPGVFTMAGQPQAFDIQLSARGVSRRTRGICSFPPLRLDFERGAVRDTALAGQNRLKLVTRCRSGANYEQLVVLEYLAYRLYNEITPHSFRVRPLRVTYRDSEGRRREETQFNFVIEDVDDLADRNGRVALDVFSGDVRSSGLVPASAAQYALFQYMIGNLDWDAVQALPGEGCCHNSKLIAASADARTEVIATPYDFDATGFVDAPYAAPPNQVNVRNIRQRLYRGYCRHNDEIPAAIAVFQARRQAINTLIAGETRLSDSRRQQAQAYVDEFYDTISDSERVRSQIIDRCR